MLKKLVNCLTQYLKNNYDVDLWELDNTWIPKTITNVITYVNKLKELQCI